MRRLVAVVLVALAACGSGADGYNPNSTKPTRPLHALHDLADGKHFGFVTALDPGRHRMVFDVAELLSGDAATNAARDDGGVVSAGGSYVRNPDDRMNNITLDDAIKIRLLTPCCELHAVSFERWLTGFDPPDTRTFYGTTKSHYEITISGGKVVTVEEVVVG